MSPASPLLFQTVALQPAVCLGCTVAVFSTAVRLQRLGRGSPLLNPTLITILVVAIALYGNDISYTDYARSSELLTFGLAPAVVLLAVPLFRKRALIRGSWQIIAAALAVGLPVGILSSIGLAWLLGADRTTLLSLAPRSTTVGIAYPLALRIGGIPALTAVLVITSGILGAVFGPLLARALRVRDERAIGLALGIASHGIGTARALQMGELTGAFAGVGLTLNGILTAIVLSLR